MQNSERVEGCVSAYGPPRRRILRAHENARPFFEGDGVKQSRESGFHAFAGTSPLICGLCGEAFPSLEAAALNVCEHARRDALRSAESVLWAVKGVLGAKHEKVTPVSGPDAGKRIKRPVDTVEKLVRIRAAVYALLPAELVEGIDDEARNRVELAKMFPESFPTGHKAWE